MELPHHPVARRHGPPFRLRVHRRKHDHAALFHALAALTRQALDVGRATPELARARSEQLASFTHFLDMPILVVIVSLGALRPNSWTQFIVATALAVAIASLLNYTIPRLYPWSGEGES